MEEAAGHPSLVVVGLGNPGGEYSQTRHNIGFRVIDAIAGACGSRDFLFHHNLWMTAADIAGSRVLLCKPDTYMNRSGAALVTLARMMDVLPDVLVVCDDVSLPLGALRLRRRGGAGGQNGLQNIIDTLGTAAIPRLRCGIGPAPGDADLADFVLSGFPASELCAVDAMVERAAAVPELILSRGFDNAMTAANTMPAARNDGPAERPPGAEETTRSEA